jgi:pilus assembly protein CpaF
MEGETILLQEIFRYRPLPSSDGKPAGELVASGLRPKFLDKLLELGIEVPAKVFHSRPGTTAGTDRKSRNVRVLGTRELAEPERAK